jgi:hypothetical protein
VPGHDAIRTKGNAQGLGVRLAIPAELVPLPREAGSVVD